MSGGERGSGRWTPARDSGRSQELDGVRARKQDGSLLETRRLFTLLNEMRLHAVYAISSASAASSADPSPRQAAPCMQARTSGFVAISLSNSGRARFVCE